jgi:DNA (cytosine-5)-methyltransferase 1
MSTEAITEALSNLSLANGKHRMVDLFAGTGAFTLAFESTGKVNVVMANDICKNAKEIYDLNFSHQMKCGDLNDIDVTGIPAHDILTGGFPCQPFSVAGMQKGFDDERSNVFWKILKILEHHKPKVVILENVKNLQSHDSGNTFKVIKESIEKLGYHVHFKVLNTCELTSIPQNRERIYIVCFTDRLLYDRFQFPAVKKKVRPIRDMLESQVPEKYYYSDRFTVWDTIEKNVVKHVDTNTVYQYRRYYIRENKSNVCPTLTANSATGGHNVPLIKDNKGIRKFTPRECFNLQGFPATYKLAKLCDSSLYKLAGNAVSVDVVKLIAEQIMALF